MAQRATIRDLAEMAGVSVSTIDRIMNGRDAVRAVTATKVLAAAEALQFYALPVLRARLQLDRPKRTLGVLLQQSQRTFYRLIADGLRQAAAECPDPVEVIIEHMDDLSPEAVSARILNLGPKVEALAVVAAEHAHVSRAIEELAGRGVRTYGLISELTASCSIGYIGLDNWRVGRTAAWAVTGLCKQPGKLGILIGNHRYRCQEMNETGFRSFCREHGAGFTVLEPLQTFEDKSIARDVTSQLLRREPDLVGLYVSGGGVVGVMEALKDHRAGQNIVAVGNDITEHTRTGLINHQLSMVFAHPIKRLSTEAIGLMLRDLRDENAVSKIVMGFDIFTPENV